MSQKQTFIFKFTSSFTLWFYTFKLSNNTFHFSPFKIFRWSFFSFEITQDWHFSPHSCSRFTMIEHMITAKNAFFKHHAKHSKVQWQQTFQISTIQIPLFKAPVKLVLNNFVKNGNFFQKKYGFQGIASLWKSSLAKSSQG